jgi:glucose-6-phosphate 1-epimerase
MKIMPEGTRLEAGPGGLERLVIAAREGEAQVYIHGAHVAHFQPRGGRPVLWMSKASQYVGGAPGKALRGGVPICFPWFGPKAGETGAPVHGLARIFAWEIESVEQLADGRVRAALALSSGDATRLVSAGEFALSFAVTVGATLTMELTVRNTGGAVLAFEEALHTYFSVSDVKSVSISGLADTPYVDKVDGATRKVQGSEPIRITGETDRVYLGTVAAVSVDDPGFKRQIRVSKGGSNTTVVWNPWIAKAKAMPDFGDHEWPEMLCVETANAIDNAITLPPGASHTLTATIEAVPA